MYIIMFLIMSTPIAIGVSGPKRIISIIIKTFDSNEPVLLRSYNSVFIVRLRGLPCQPYCPHMIMDGMTASM